MAVPPTVDTTIVVGTLLGLLIDTTKLALVPSVAVALAMVTVGIGVASIITPVVLAVVLPVLPEVTVAVNTNVSVPSLILSIVVGTFTVTLVAPAGMVTVVFTVVKSDVPAVPVVVVMFTTVGTLLGVLICTTNTALVPSLAGVLVTDTIGNAVASIIVPVACAEVVWVLVDTNVPVNVNPSVPSLMLSVNALNGTATVVAPAGMVTCVVVTV